MIDATRELHGLRPKDAVLLAARALAAAVGAQSVHAVSDANHVLKRLQDIAKFSGYDDYWIERGGAPGGPYGFILEALEDPGAGAKRRDDIKAAIVEGVNVFARDHRRGATRRHSDIPLVALAPA